MQAKDIERYLEQLGQELASRGIQRPIRILLIGGAYMLLLANALRPTDDVDFFWLEDENPLPPEVRVVSECVQIVSKKNSVDPHWFNYLTQALMYDKIRIPDNWLWKKHGPLCIHMPPTEYIVALKILAGRQKDIEDCKLLLPMANITTRQQAQQYLDRYILPDELKKQAEKVENSLKALFETEQNSLEESEAV